MSNTTTKTPLNTPTSTDNTPSNTSATDEVSKHDAIAMRDALKALEPGKMGRPPAVIDPKEVEKCAEIGMTLEQIAEGLGISDQTLRKHRGTNDAINIAYKRGQHKARQQLLEQIQKNNKAGNVASQIFTAKQRHTLGWADQQEVNHSGGITFNINTGVAGKEREPIDITPEPDED